MAETLNYKLKKPGQDEFYNVEDDNFNMDEIDKHLKNNADNITTKVAKVEGKQLSTEDYTTEEKNKLAGIDKNANNYMHPNDPNTRHITDVEREKWNGYGSELADIAKQVTEEKFQPFTANSSITSLENSVDGGMIDIEEIRGKTLINLAKPFKRYKATNPKDGSYNNHDFPLYSKLVGGKTYTFFVYYSENKGDYVLDNFVIATDWNPRVWFQHCKVTGTTSGVVKSTFTVPTGLAMYSDLKAIMSLKNIDCYIDKIMVLEGDWTNKEISYFEGVQSVRNTELSCVNEDGSDKSSFLLQDYFPSEFSEEDREARSLPNGVSDFWATGKKVRELYPYLNVKDDEFYHIDTVGKYIVNENTFDTGFALAGNVYYARISLSKLNMGIKDDMSDFYGGVIGINNDSIWKNNTKSVSTVKALGTSSDSLWIVIPSSFGLNTKEKINNYLKINPITMLYERRTPQIYHIDKIPNLSTFKNCSFHIKGRKKVILDGSNISSYNENKDGYKKFLYINPDKDFIHQGIQQDFTDGFSLYNENNRMYENVNADKVNACGFYERAFTFTISDEETGFSGSGTASEDQIKDYFNKHLHVLEYNTKDTVLPEVIGRYAINVGGAISSLGIGVNNNSKSIQNLSDKHEILALQFATHVANEIIKWERLIHKEAITLDNYTNLKIGSALIYANTDIDIPAELIVE